MKIFFINTLPYVYTYTNYIYLKNSKRSTNWCYKFWQKGLKFFFFLILETWHFRNAAKLAHEPVRSSVWALHLAGMCLCRLALLGPSVLFSQRLPRCVCPSGLISHKRLRNGAVVNQPAETVKVSIILALLSRNKTNHSPSQAPF